ncbi:hypothetical protein ACJX0J_024027, partial [Zea mays]
LIKYIIVLNLIISCMITNLIQFIHFHNTYLLNIGWNWHTNAIIGIHVDGPVWYDCLIEKCLCFQIMKIFAIFQFYELYFLFFLENKWGYMNVLDRYSPISVPPSNKYTIINYEHELNY